MKRHGPASKLTPDVADAIVESIEAGSFAAVAARAAGVSKNSFWRWVHKGREPGAEKMYTDFAARVATASATAETDAVKVVRNSMVDGDWQAAAWYLERRTPSRWGKTRDMTITHRGSVEATPAMARAVMAELFALAPPVENDQPPALPPARESGPELVDERRAIQAGR